MIGLSGGIAGVGLAATRLQHSTIVSRTTDDTELELEQQVRISGDESEDDGFPDAIYTIASTHEGAAVRLTRSGLDRIGASDSSTATVGGQAVHPEVGVGLSLGGDPAMATCQRLGTFWLLVPFMSGGLAYATAVTLRRNDILESVGVSLLAGIVAFSSGDSQVGLATGPLENLFRIELGLPGITLLALGAAGRAWGRERDQEPYGRVQSRPLSVYRRAGAGSALLETIL